MYVQNEENKTPGTRGNKENIRYEPDRDGGAGARYISGIDGHKSFGDGRENREGQNSASDSGRETPGGVVDDLIAEIQNQLTESQDRTERLKNAFTRLTALRTRINKNIE